MRSEDCWTMGQLTALLLDLSSSGWAVRMSTHQLHSGDPKERPWTGPIACYLTVSGWGAPGPVSLDDVNKLGELTARHGIQMELSLGYSQFDEDSHGGVAKLGVNRWGERILVNV